MVRVEQTQVERLIARFLDGDDGARRQLAQLVEASEEDRACCLDAVANHASTGSAECLDLLLTLVDHNRLAIGAIRAIVASDAAVQDIAQETLIACASSISHFRGESSFLGWLRGIARNQAKQYVRSNARRGTREERSVELRPSERISSMIATRETVREAISTLPEAYRESVVLRDIEQQSYDEIAQRLQIEINTVRSRISRGRALLASTVVI